MPCWRHHLHATCRPDKAFIDAAHFSAAFDFASPLSVVLALAHHGAHSLRCAPHFVDMQIHTRVTGPWVHAVPSSFPVARVTAAADRGAVLAVREAAGGRLVACQVGHPGANQACAAVALWVSCSVPFSGDESRLVWT